MTMGFLKDGFDSESHMEHFLSENIELIEPGMKFISNQSLIGSNRYIDILATDKNGVLCLIELKAFGKDRRLVQQCLDYSKALKGSGRLIVIAPWFDVKQLSKIKDIQSIEFKEIKVNANKVLIHGIDPETYEPDKNIEIIKSEPNKIENPEPSYVGPSKEHHIGNTTIIVHSPLVEMTSEERADWFKEEWEKGNQVLKEIAAAVEDCYRT